MILPRSIGAPQKVRVNPTTKGVFGLIKYIGKIENSELSVSKWKFLSVTFDYVKEVATEIWQNPSGEKTTLYRRYGGSASARYREIQEVEADV